MMSYESQINKLVAGYGRTAGYVVDNIPLYIHRRRLSRLLCHYELFKQTIDLPGKIVECGVYRGSSLMLWVKLLDIFCMGDTSKRVIGFDTFSGFVNIGTDDVCDSDFTERREGGFNADSAEAEIHDLIELFDQDRFAPESARAELVNGDIVQTAPAYVASHRDLRISLLHLDLDLYEPTLAALHAFYPLVVKGGVVVVDDYALDDWPGAAKAVEKYFGETMPILRKFHFRESPGGYFVK